MRLLESLGLKKKIVRNDKEEKSHKKKSIKKKLSKQMN